jgi:hypothetical protein
VKATHGKVTPISGMTHAPAAAAPLSPAFVLEAQTRLAWMTAKQLPQLAQLCEMMEKRAAHWQGAALEQALCDHLAAVEALRFELLVGAGLRAGPLDRDEVAFRTQVALVSSCTESAWTEIRGFLERAEPAGHADEPFSDFTLELRSVQRGVAELTPQLERLLQDLKNREAEAATALGRQALAELAQKAVAVLQRLQRLGRLHAAGHEVQKLAYRLGDEGAACRGTLRRLAQALGRGLLERLRALIALEHFAPGEDIHAAQQARAELQAQLVDAIEQVNGLREAQHALQQALAAMGRQVAAAGS